MYLDELIEDLNTLSQITDTLDAALEGHKRKEPLTLENGQGLFEIRDFLLDFKVRLSTLLPRGPIPTLGCSTCSNVSSNVKNSGDSQST